ncbi:MAG: ATPase, partial [Gammaproteobacteria bacterium]|nr:ATPase [Gammaproteobacteria bacterium]
AEIEQAVVAARYSAAAVEKPLSQTLLEEEIARTQPLSVLMGEQVEALRQWALGRTVLA